MYIETIRLCILLLLLISPSNSFITPDFAALQHEATVIDASVTLGDYTAPVGSLMGGTELYIRGTYFNDDAAKNKVWVGPYPCEILADGATENSLACRTTAAYDEDQTWDLPLKVEVDTRGTVTCTSSVCRFRYRDDKTPFIQEIVPRTVVGNQNLYVYGYHRISDLGDERSNGAGEIRHMLIGDNLCSLLDVDQASEESFKPNSREQITCRSFLHQVAG